MIGPALLSISSAWLRGFNAGYRRAGHSLFRRLFLALFVWAVLLGSGIGFLWSSAEVFFRLAADEEITTKTVVSKVRAWNTVYKPRHTR